MRDGIYKTCPVKQVWQIVLRLALRPADRGQRVTDAVLRALVRDIKGSSITEHIQKSRKLLESGQQDLFAAKDPKMHMSHLPPARSKLTNDFQENLLYSISKGQISAQDVLISASTDSLKEHLECMKREIVGHVFKNCSGFDPEVKRTVQSVENSIDSVSNEYINTISRDIIQGNNINESAPPKPTFDLDEDLT